MTTFLRGAKVPGELGLWIFIFGDLLVLGAMFCTYLFYRVDAPALYASSQGLLNRDMGAFNTLVLLTSPWFVAAAVQDAEQGRTRTTASKLGAGWCFGVAFINLKLTEYDQRFHAGINAATNDFFMFYFVPTGIHFLHVLVGLAVLGYFCRPYAVGRAAGTSLNNLETGGVFCRLIDLLWIMLFPLLYLVRWAGREPMSANAFFNANIEARRIAAVWLLLSGATAVSRGGSASSAR